ncbi:MAG: hypothetical protein VKJ24_05170 [Synechococcales bacterium]|nr:hypothetical protein [Synechococcales bacterium]
MQHRFDSMTVRSQSLGLSLLGIVLLGSSLFGGSLVGASKAIAEPPDEGFTPDFIFPPLMLQDFKDLNDQTLNGTPGTAALLQGTQAMNPAIAFPPIQPILATPRQDRPIGGTADDLQFTSPIVLDTSSFRSTTLSNTDARTIADMLFPFESRSSAKVVFSVP